MPEYRGLVPEEAGGLRLDRYAAERLALMPRSQIKARALKAVLDGKPVKVSRLLRGGERIELEWAEYEHGFLIPEDIPLDVVYEDGRVIVVNKAQGMVVHPGAGNRCGTLANALLFRRNAAATENTRAGIVHRLDKDTSGLIIAAWDDEALALLSDEFKSRRAKKTYAAIVVGAPPEPEGKLETFLRRDPRGRKKFAVSDAAGKRAVTLYKVLRNWGSHSFVLLRPKTGRTHQLRVHMRHLGCPIAGDPLYGRGRDPLFPALTLMLHSRRLVITLPDETEPRTFNAPLPERFAVMMKKLDGRV